MNIDHEAAKTVSFSGYRSDKLPDGGIESADSINSLKADLFDAVSESFFCGFDSFLVGMADGFDFFAAEMVISAKKENPQIKFIAVVPFDDGRKHTKRYNDIIAHADDVVTLADEYSQGTVHIMPETNT